VGERRIPERTCIACRARGPKGSFVRIVRTPEGRVAFDPTGREAGRGAYLHPGCLDRAERSGALARALRTPLGRAEAARLMTDVRAAPAPPPERSGVSA